jgi:hypothetical protein
MTDTLGVIALWLIGGNTAFYVPVIFYGLWAKTGDRLSRLVFGVSVGLIAVAAYIIATVAYLAIT